MRRGTVDNSDKPWPVVTCVVYNNNNKQLEVP